MSFSRCFDMQNELNLTIMNPCWPFGGNNNNYKTRQLNRLHAGLRAKIAMAWVGGGIAPLLLPHSTWAFSMKRAWFCPYLCPPPCPPLQVALGLLMLAMAALLLLL